MAKMFNNEIIKLIENNDHEKIINFSSMKNLKLAVPTIKHFLPLLYILALKFDTDKIQIFNNEIDLGSISMTSISLMPSTII